MKDPKRILVLSDAWQPQVNGVVRTYEHLAAELEKDGHVVGVVGPQDFPWRVRLPFYQEIELALNVGRHLERHIESFAPDFIHIATEGPIGQAGRAYCARRGYRFTTAYHTHFPDYIARRVGRVFKVLASPARRASIALVRRFHAPAGAVMTATESLEKELRSWGFTAPLHRVTRGVHFDLFHPGPATLFAALPRPVALYVGRVAVEKSIEDFLAMRWCGSKVVVGDGPDRVMLERRYPDALFMGTQKGEALAACYRSADLFVFPSRTDTFGMVLVEALAAGLPVAAYDVTGPRDIITVPHLGALHPDDLAAAADKAMESAAQKDERHAHARTHYSWPAAAAQFMDILRQVGK